MITKNLTKKSIVKILVFYFSTWIIGIIFAIWLGLGYFLLIETLRRIMITIPAIYIRFLRIMFGEERAIEEENSLKENYGKPIYYIRYFATIIWIIVTIFVFLHYNIRLIDYFSN